MHKILKNQIPRSIMRGHMESFPLLHNEKRLFHPFLGSKLRWTIEIQHVYLVEVLRCVFLWFQHFSTTAALYNPKNVVFFIFPFGGLNISPLPFKLCGGRGGEIWFVCRFSTSSKCTCLRFQLFNPAAPSPSPPLKFTFRISLWHTNLPSKWN